MTSSPAVLTSENLLTRSANAQTALLRTSILPLYADLSDDQAAAALQLLFDTPAKTLCYTLAQAPATRVRYRSPTRIVDGSEAHVRQINQGLARLEIHAPQTAAAIGRELQSDRDHDRAGALVALVVLLLAYGR